MKNIYARIITSYLLTFAWASLGNSVAIAAPEPGRGMGLEIGSCMFRPNQAIENGFARTSIRISENAMGQAIGSTTFVWKPESINEARLTISKRPSAPFTSFVELFNFFREADWIGITLGGLSGILHEAQSTSGAVRRIFLNLYRDGDLIQIQLEGIHGPSFERYRQGLQTFNGDTRANRNIPRG